MVVCAWCQIQLLPAPVGVLAAGAPHMSHGICPSCLAAQLSSLDTTSNAPAPGVR